MKTSLCLFILITSVLALSACASPTATITTTVTIGPTGTVTSPSTTNPTSTPAPTLTGTNILPTTPATPVEPLVFPDNGNIRVGGEGYFRFQRVFDAGWAFDPSAGAIIFEGVAYAAHAEAPGVTTTGPLAYKIDVQFADGTVEVLQYIGFGNLNSVDFNFSKHEHPKAGIMMAWHDVSGGLRNVRYLLVSDQ